MCADNYCSIKALTVLLHNNTEECLVRCEFVLFCSFWSVWYWCWMFQAYIFSANKYIVSSVCFCSTAATARRRASAVACQPAVEIVQQTGQLMQYALLMLIETWHLWSVVMLYYDSSPVCRFTCGVCCICLLESLMWFMCNWCIFWVLYFINEETTLNYRICVANCGYRQLTDSSLTIIPQRWEDWVSKNSCVHVPSCTELRKRM